MLTGEPSDGSFFQHAEGAAHDAGTGASGGRDGTQDLLNKEQQVGHVDIQVLPIRQPAGINLTRSTSLKDLREGGREEVLVPTGASDTLHSPKDTAQLLTSSMQYCSVLCRYDCPISFMNSSMTFDAREFPRNSVLESLW